MKRLTVLGTSFGAIVVLALAAGFAVRDGQEGSVRIAKAPSGEVRYGGGGAGREEPIRHVLPGANWFRKADESRLRSVPRDSDFEIVEHPDGRILILDVNEMAVLEQDPASRTTVIVENFVVPPITPRQPVDQSVEISFWSPDADSGESAPADDALASDGVQ